MAAAQTAQIVELDTYRPYPAVPKFCDPKPSATVVYFHQRLERCPRCDHPHQRTVKCKRPQQDKA